MKIGIDAGHNCPPDTGASGIKFEDKLTLDVATRVIAKLRTLGHQVVFCNPNPNEVKTVNDSLRLRCQVANHSQCDLYVSIHFNAANKKASGTEIFAISNRGKSIANNVLSEIIKLGFVNRGVKQGNQYFVLRNTNMVAILIECCFVDSEKDMSLFDPEKMADAIVRGIPK